MPVVRRYASEEERGRLEAWLAQKGLCEDDLEADDCKSRLVVAVPDEVYRRLAKRAEGMGVTPTHLMRGLAFELARDHDGEVGRKSRNAGAGPRA